MIATLVSLFICSAFANHSQTIVPDPSKDASGYVLINGQKIWVEYLAPQPGQPLIINLNGLTYSTEQWHDYVRELRQLMPGAGVLNYDMRLQGRTLAVIPNNKAMYQEIAKAANAFGELTKVRSPSEYWERWISGQTVLDMVEWNNQVMHLQDLISTMATSYPLNDVSYVDDTADLRELIKEFRGSSDVHIVGLSYGGAIGLDFLSKFSQDITSAIILAPFMKSLPMQDSWIRVQMQIFRAMFPFVAVEDGTLYDFFLRVLVYATYPSAEPVILENYLKLEATYRKAQGSKTFNAYNITDRFPTNGKLHLIASVRDEYVEKAWVDDLWDITPRRARGSYSAINGVGHKIVEEAPGYTARLIAEIVDGNKNFTDGKTLIGDAATNQLPRPVSEADIHDLHAVIMTRKRATNPFWPLFPPKSLNGFTACNKIFAY